MGIIDLIFAVTEAAPTATGVALKAADKVLEANEKVTGKIGVGLMNVSEKHDIKLKKHMQKMLEDYPDGAVFYLQKYTRSHKRDLKGTISFVQYKLLDIHDNLVYYTNEYKVENNLKVHVYNLQDKCVGNIQSSLKWGRRKVTVTFHGKDIKFDSTGAGYKTFDNNKYEFLSNSFGTQYRLMKDNQLVLKRVKDIAPIILFTDKNMIDENVILFIGVTI